MSLPNISDGRLADADVVAEALAHLLHAVEPFEERHHERDLLRLAFLALQIAADEDIEKLIGAADLDVGLHLHGIPALDDRVLDFVEADGRALLETLVEILALEHLLER